VLRAVWLGTLLIPVAVLAAGALRTTGQAQTLLWLGTIFQFLACVLALTSRQTWTDLTGPPMIMLYVIALSWMLLGTINSTDWYPHLAQAILLVMALVLFGGQCLIATGAPTIRRARQLAARLARRRDWPGDLQACRDLPEVKALRDALHLDAGPVFPLLGHPRVQVRIAVLAALEFRQNWEVGQAEVILHLAKNATEPEVRAGALLALGNLDDRNVLEPLAEYLWDPVLLVRMAAGEALLWNTEYRWTWLRLAVRQALAHPVCQEDGPLCREGQLLPPEVVADLTGWAAEKGTLSMRAALTLGTHYLHALHLGHDPNLASRLRQTVVDPHTSAVLRLELARLLYQHRELDGKVALALVGASIPAPVRLIGVETLLSQGPSDEAVSALRDLARLPNREIALATAEVVQRRLGVNLGLPRGEALPPVNSRLAADVARRVLQWATQDPASVDDSEPTAPRRTV
jgi:hypothetical protein